MSTGPDIAGLYAALRRLPDRTDGQRQAYRVATSAHRASRAMQSGRRYATERLVRRPQLRDPLTGRFMKAS